MGKRFLIVVSEPELSVSGEGWKTGHVDLEAVRQQVREQLQEAVPVVILPPGAYLSVVEWGEDEKKGEGKETAEKKTGEGER